MNSLNDNHIDEQLDQLLAASVRPGSEPAGFAVPLMPPRPKFNWKLAGGLFAVISLALVLMVTMAIGQTSIVPAVSEHEIWMLLNESLMVGAENLSSSTFLLYAAAVMGAVYLFTGSRIVRLYRLH